MGVNFARPRRKVELCELGTVTRMHELSAWLVSLSMASLSFDGSLDGMHTSAQ